MNRLLTILIGLSVLFTSTSCNNDKRLMKKFIYRMNAHEVNAASKYIYDADHAGLYLFNSAIYAKSPNTLFKIKGQQKSVVNGQPCVIVTLECLNMSGFFEDYMSKHGFLTEDNLLVDTIFIRETDDGKRLSFNWMTIKGESLKLASIADPEKVKQLNIRSGPGTNYAVIGKLDETGKIVIDEYSQNTEWVKCYILDQQCNIKEGFISSGFIKSENRAFFSLGIFGNLGLIVALIILVIIGLPLFFIRSIFEAFGELPVAGVLICVGLVLALLFALYQLLENILFELFLINLPW